MRPNWREDKTLLVLAFFTLASGAAFAFLAYFPPKDVQILTVAQGSFTGFAGALTLHLKSDRVAPSGSETTVDTHQESKVEQGK